MHNTPCSPKFLYLLVFCAGMAALSWEAVWQIKSTLALGVSAWGTALTLSITMGGMCIGALGMGRFLKGRQISAPLKLYAYLEVLIGLSGLYLASAFAFIAQIDAQYYTDDLGSLIHIAGIIATLGLPTLCMGATLPVLGLISQQADVSLSKLYGFNTLGAAIGVLLAAFVFVPAFGIQHASWFITGINLLVALVAFIFAHRTLSPKAQKPKPANTVSGANLPFRTAMVVAFVTGFSTFCLEVAWFRSLTSAFKSSTEAFAIMLSVVLLALGTGSAMAAALKRNGVNLGVLLAISGILILIVTPVIERFDLKINAHGDFPALLFFQWFVSSLYTIGLGILFMGIALPWILDEQNNTTHWSKLYALNAFAAIAGAILAAWVLLPAIGFARTAWLVGILVTIMGLYLCPRQKQVQFAVLGIGALAIAFIFESGVGRTRIQGTTGYKLDVIAQDIVDFYEGPEGTVSVVETTNGQRSLFIDGFVATAQDGDYAASGHYMEWMGHMPMLLHPDPKDALVICFGTGQTANAVRKEGPDTLDIVDINKNVFKLAKHFTSNDAVLEDERVNSIVMDGRAYMRRTKKLYDVITLEPMPPTFAGVNALYSKEFYERARSKLNKNGIIAQWLPFHIVSGEYSAAVFKTFHDVFPNALLWVDPVSTTGIILGSKNDTRTLSSDFFGYSRKQIERSLSVKDVKDAIILEGQSADAYAAMGETITDDNQLLAYGKASYLFRNTADKSAASFALIEKARQK